jgi:hypothetical protein
MGIFDNLFGGKSDKSDQSRGLIGSGGQKKTGGHNHQTNKGDDRTPAQKEGDKKREKKASVQS